jgi:hypothetical protein
MLSLSLSLSLSLKVLLYSSTSQRKFRVRVFYLSRMLLFFLTMSEEAGHFAVT